MDSKIFTKCYICGKYLVAGLWVENDYPSLFKLDSDINVSHGLCPVHAFTEMQRIKNEIISLKRSVE
jgi:hypothetical protein